MLRYPLIDLDIYVLNKKADDALIINRIEVKSTYRDELKANLKRALSNIMRRVYENIQKNDYAQFDYTAALYLYMSYLS